MKKTIKYFMYSIFILFFVVSCHINEWNSPWWDITLVVPLVNDSFPIIDLSGDENFEIVEQQVFFVTNDDIEEAEIEDGDLKLSPSEGSTPLALINSVVRGNIPIIEDDDDVQIIHAVVSSGQLDFEFRSVSANITTITVTFDEIRNVDNSPKVVTIQRQGSDFNHSSSLIGYNLRNMPPNHNDLVEILNFTVEIVSSDGGNTSGFMRVHYENPIYFSRIYGILDNLRIDTPDVITDIDVDWPINIENAIHVRNPLMIINVMNYLNFPATFNATITAFNDRNPNIVPLTFDVSIYLEPTPNIEIGTLRVIKIVPTASTPIDLLMNIAPDRIEITNAHMMVVNPNKERGHARVGTAFYGDVETRVPFSFLFLGEPVFPAEPETIEISKSNRENIEKRVENARLRVVLANSYSLGGTLQLHFSYRENDHDFMYQDESVTGQRLVIKEDNMLRPLRLEAAENVNEPFEVTYYIDLTRDELKMFHMHEEIYFGFKMVFDAGETVILPEETIRIIARLIATVMVDFD